MPDWMFWILGFVFGPVPIAGIAIIGFYAYYRFRYIDVIIRIFEEKPLFIIPRGNPINGAEDVRILTPEGLELRGYYRKTPAAVRRGVILFGLEYGSSRWSSVSYSDRLSAIGYDVFTYEPRNQGDSDKDATYEPMPWSTDRDLADMRTAIKYLHYRPDADPAGVGIFGISKGGSLGLLIASEDRLVRCVATDGAFGTYTTVVPFLRKWVSIYLKRRNWIRKRIPDWFYGMLGLAAIKKVAKKRNIEFVSVEKAVRRMKQPLLMIHGGGDNYIKPEMAETLFSQAKRVTAKELWIVPGAKHNLALHVAREEYHAKLIAFFDRHLGGNVPQPAAAPMPRIPVDERPLVPVVAAR